MALNEEVALMNYDFSSWSSVLKWFRDNYEPYKDFKHVKKIFIASLPNDEVEFIHTIHYKDGEKFFESTQSLEIEKTIVPKQILETLNHEEKADITEMVEKMMESISDDFDTSKFDDVDMGKYAKKYSEGDLWKKVKGNVKKAGLSLIYNALQLYYVTENPNCPMKVKAGIFAALGYFISPIDLIPDFTPIVGYSDDGGAILLAIGMAQMYIDDTVKEKSKEKIRNLFGEDVVAELN